MTQGVLRSPSNFQANQASATFASNFQANQADNDNDNVNVNVNVNDIYITKLIKFKNQQ